MNGAAFSELLGVVDEAIALADDAVKSAEARPKTDTITLVKVARSRYHSVAGAIIKSGAFPGESEDSIAKNLEEGGIVAQLDLLEKLASRAVFPFDLSGDLGGDLVEKSAAYRTAGSAPETRTELWARSWEEAEAECAG